MTLHFTLYDGDCLERMREIADGSVDMVMADLPYGTTQNKWDSVFAWLSALRDRLCSVRIACGSWERVLTSSVCENHGLTGIFLDPPYEGTEYVYRDETLPLSAAVRQWCLTNGARDCFRIVLAGRATEHDELLAHGWTKQFWTANRGYSFKANEGRKKEALWLSPHCLGENSPKYLGI